MPARYGKLEEGKCYTIQQVLEHIDELEDGISALENERDELRESISDMKEQVAMYYRPASPYEVTGIRESDFH